MNFFNKILLPVDFSGLSNASIGKALEIALKCSSQEIHLVGVVSIHHLHTLFTSDTIAFMHTHLMDAQIANAKQKLTQIINSSENPAGIPIVCEVFQGQFVQIIDKYIADQDIEFVVMATNGIGGVNDFLVECNVQKVSAIPRCPVLTIQPFRPAGGSNKMIVSVEEHFPMNKLHYAAILAKLLSAEIHLLCLSEKFQSIKPNTFPVLFQVTEQLDLLSISYKIYASPVHQRINDAILRYSEAEKIDMILFNPSLITSTTFHDKKQMAGLKELASKKSKSD